MEVKNPYLVISAPDSKSWPDSELPEIVMAGRSNVGKRSLETDKEFIHKKQRLRLIGRLPIVDLSRRCDRPQSWRPPAS